MTYSYKKFIPVAEQLAAIIHPPAPLLIIAGAGTGKTATLLHRIRYQILHHQMKPENILIMTFTEKATAELHERILELNIPNSDRITISTFHAFCFQIVKDARSDQKTALNLIQDHDSIFMMLHRFDELSFLKSAQFRLHPQQAVQDAFIPFFNRVRDELLSQDELVQLRTDTEISPDNLAAWLPGLSPKVSPEEALNQLDDLIRVYALFQEWKQQAQVVDYGDMILSCWDLLTANPDVLNQVRKKYRHLIVDEYQDNNFALNKIITHIVGDNPSLTVVGDEDQCIYSFRGANYYNIQDFRERYQSHPKFKKITLETNFRSHQAILDLANASIRRDQNRSEKFLKVHDKNLTGPKPVWIQGTNEPALVTMSDKIMEMLDSRYQAEDITILCRTIKQVNQTAAFLESRNIQVQVFRDRFAGIPEIRQLITWSLVITENPRFRIAFAKLAHELGMNTQHLRRDFNFKNINQSFSEDQKTPQFTDLVKKIESLRNKMQQGAKPVEMLWHILDVSRLLDSTKHHYRYRDRLALRNIGYVLSVAQHFSRRHPEAGFDSWITYFDLLIGNQKAPALEPQSNYPGHGVRIMTVHRSKGLEFPVVFIPYLNSASFPLNYSPQTLVNTIPEPWYQWALNSGFSPKLEHTNEERRIFYVAVTRAREELYLLGPEKRTSSLLNELRPEWPDLLTIYQADIKEDDHMPKKSNPIEQKLLNELNRELGQHHWDNARSLIHAMEDLDMTGRVREENPYSVLNNANSGAITNLDEPLTLSASAVEEYHQCPYKYRLSRVDNIPQRKSSAQMGFGTIIHDVLNKFHDDENNQSEKALLELLDQCWNPESFEYKIREDEFYRQGQEMLKSYWAYLPKMKSQFLAGERKFSFELRDCNVVILGKIDRIDQNGDTLDVIDYKTGNKSSRDETRKSLQLALYIEALRRDAVTDIHGKPGTAQLLFLKNLDELYDPCLFTLEDIDNHLDTVRSAAAGIRAHKFPQKPDDYSCRYCDYKDFLCPAWEND